MRSRAASNASNACARAVTDSNPGPNRTPEPWCRDPIGGRPRAGNFAFTGVRVHCAHGGALQTLLESSQFEDARHSLAWRHLAMQLQDDFERFGIGIFVPACRHAPILARRC